jgi:formiminotetrahydrofolate cyclodeaminase
VSRSVREFVAAVAAPEQAVPAGGSVAALTGACCAALLALACGVLMRRQSDNEVEAMRGQAEALRERLLGLVEEDAAAYRAFLEARRSGGDRQAEVARVSQAPLDIARACADVVDLSGEVEKRSRGPLLGDVRTARQLAHAACMAALDLAEQDVALHTEASAQQQVRDEVARLRRR